MRRALTIALYVVLAAVVASSVQTLAVGVSDRIRYEQIFPGARGLRYWATLSSSALAGVTAVFIALRRRWATQLNPLVGLASVVLVGRVGGPPTTQAVIVIACAVSTVVSWCPWHPGRAAAA